MSTKAARSDRIVLRVTREEKHILVRAAAAECLDLTDFIMRSALPTAREVLDNAIRIVLSERDTERVLELLTNPPPPAEALIKAFKSRRGRR